MKSRYALKNGWKETEKKSYVKYKHLKFPCAYESPKGKWNKARCFVQHTQESCSSRVK